MNGIDAKVDRFQIFANCCHYNHSLTPVIGIGTHSDRQGPIAIPVVAMPGQVCSAGPNWRYDPAIRVPRPTRPENHEII